MNVVRKRRVVMRKTRGSFGIGPIFTCYRERRVLLCGKRKKKPQGQRVDFES